MHCFSLSDWGLFKNIVITKKNLGLQYSETSSYYTIVAGDHGMFIWLIILDKNTSDSSDFETYYKNVSNKEIDTNGKNI